MWVKYVIDILLYLKTFVLNNFILN